MKTYQKPQMVQTELISFHGLASLNQWLESNNLAEAGITTYLVAS